MKKTVVILGILLFLLVLILGVNQWLYLRKAHNTFENYYTFRGCAQLLKKTDTYGICKLASGEQIKIVKYDNKWYLNGDLPWACIGKVCFGF